MAVPAQAKSKEQLHKDVLTAIKLVKDSDSSIEKFFKESYAYAVFPTIKKGGFGIGAAGGSGEFFEKNAVIGTVSLKQFTIGFQLGGQVYTEILFFENEEAAKKFKASKFKLSAQATAVAASEGVAAKAKYQYGMAIFTLARGGLMYEASVGGQKFKYKAIK